MFKFEMSQEVTVKLTAETGVVEGRCEFLESPTTYYVVYLDKTGSLKKEWIDEKHLNAASVF